LRIAAGGKDARHAGTFHAFGGMRHFLLRCHDRVRHGRTPRRIDWILLKDGRRRLRTEAHAILRDRDAESGIYPSDHCPTLATLARAG
jgi:endonuclease/exonuclease/phosphatase family metal-dependent hydrolase